MTDIPEGFAPHERTSPATRAWGPIYVRRQPRALHLGVRLGEAHCNSRGFIHGGVIAALADNAMGLSLHVAAAEAGAPASKGGAVTVSLAIDYVGAGRLGQWLQIEPRVVKSGRTLGFVDALITADGETIARANATFRVLD